MKKIPPVTFEDLKRIFSSRDFCDGLRKSKEVSLKIGFETQFSFWKETFSNEVRYFPVAESTFSDSFYYTSHDTSVENNEEIIERKLFPLLRYHCHGDPFLIPSLDDLKANLTRCIEDSVILNKKGDLVRIINFPLECIGGIKDKGKLLEILIYQSRPINPSSHDAKRIHNYLLQELGKRVDDNYAVAEVINNLQNQRAVLIRYKENKDSYQIPEKELNRLERFAYSPQLGPKILLLTDLLKLEKNTNFSGLKLEKKVLVA